MIQDSTSEYIHKEIEIRDLNRYLYIHVHSSIIPNSQKVETAQMSINRWMGKQNVVYYTPEWYLALKWNEILIHAITWMNLEDIVHSERNQTKRINIAWFNSHEMSRIGKSIQTKNKLVVASGWGAGIRNAEWQLVRTGFLLGN